MNLVRKILQVIGEIFDDWLTRLAGIVCLLIVAIVIFNMNSDLAEDFPLLGTLIFAMVPILFVAGGIIFFLAILKFSRQGNNDETTQSPG